MCLNHLRILSSKWGWEGLAKSTDLLALGGPPFKNSSSFVTKRKIQLQIFIIIADEFRNASASLADEFRNYTSLSDCCS